MNKFNGAAGLKAANLLSKLGSAEGTIAAMEQEAKRIGLKNDCQQVQREAMTDMVKTNNLLKLQISKRDEERDKLITEV